MKKQIGVIVLNDDINVESFKQPYIDRYENVDHLKQKSVKLKFVEDGDDDGSHWIEVWEE